jgi:hypothetical protein
LNQMILVNDLDYFLAIVQWARDGAACRHEISR